MAPNGQPPPPQVVIPGAGWVDVASRVVVQVGFPVVVAGVLLWFVLGKFQDNMNTITARMERNAVSLEAFTGELETHTVELRQQTAYLAEQSKTIGRIADHAAKLVQIREEELNMMKRRPNQ
jgi:K+ transporter